MTRREFAACLAGAPAAGEPVRPKALREGDTVGLITPATYVSDPDTLLLAERTLAHFGLRGKFGRNVRKRVGYMGGSVEERVEDLHAAFAALPPDALAGHHLTWISGPSKTADIEQTLVLGAHGPRALAVLGFGAEPLR